MGEQGNGAARAIGHDATLRLVEQGTRAHVAGAGDPLVIAARDEVRRRNDRRMVLGPNLPIEPVWDMLLDLYLAGMDGRRVAVSSLCIAASVPTTTALRWIKIMEDHGLVARRRDREDGRRSFVDLTASAREKIELLLRRMAHSRQDG